MNVGERPRCPPIGLLGPLRFAIRLIAMLLLLIACLPSHYVAKLATGRSRWPRYFLVGTVGICGARVRIEGELLRRTVLLVANHLTWFDIPVLGSVTDAAFVANDGVRHWPIVGWLAVINRTVFVARSDRLGVADQIAAIRTALARHRPVAIFPEGTTSDGSGVLPFKPSLFAGLADPPPGVRVQPLLIDYGAAAGEIAWIGEEGAPYSAWRLLAREPLLTVRLHFLEPFDPADCDGRKAIAAIAYQRIRAALLASLAAEGVV